MEVSVTCGAIIGDIIGSRFEFDNGHKSKEFELFTKEHDYTDDTVMTVAVAEVFWGMPIALVEQASRRFSEEILTIISRFMLQGDNG